MFEMLTDFADQNVNIIRRLGRLQRERIFLRILARRLVPDEHAARIALEVVGFSLRLGVAPKKLAQEFGMVKEYLFYLGFCDSLNAFAPRLLN